MRASIFVFLTILSWSCGNQNNNLAKRHPVSTCPKCSDPYDYTTCTETQECHTHVTASCVFHVNRSDSNRIHYDCRNVRGCQDHHVEHCSQDDGPCFYCCEDVESCQQQRETLFSSVYTTVTTTNKTPPVTATTRETTTAQTTTTLETTTSTLATTTTGTTTTPATTTSEPTTKSLANHPVTTSFPAITTPRRNTTTLGAATTITSTTLSTTTTTEATTSLHLDTTTIAPIPVNQCYQCGNLTTGLECSSFELLFRPTTSCTPERPLCVSKMIQEHTSAKLIKGCASVETCKQDWWENTHTNADCDNPDINEDMSISCTYCCKDDLCNGLMRPEDSSLVMYA